jgi:hypothetical protein
MRPIFQREILTVEASTDKAAVRAAPIRRVKVNIRRPSL